MTLTDILIATEELNKERDRIAEEVDKLDLPEGWCGVLSSIELYLSHPMQVEDIDETLTTIRKWLRIHIPHYKDIFTSASYYYGELFKLNYIVLSDGKEIMSFRFVVHQNNLPKSVLKDGCRIEEDETVIKEKRIVCDSK